MSKKNLFMLIFLFLIIVILILVKVTETPINDRIISYLEKNNYVLKSEKLYFKQISQLNLANYNYSKNKKINSTYEFNNFSLADYQLTKSINEYQDEVENILDLIYDYTNSSLIYTYRISYQNSNNIYKGSYDENNDNFICQKEFSYGMNNTNLETTICEKIKYQVLKFNYEATTFFTNPELVSYMKKQKIE